jgi:MORN repeat protein
VGEAWDRAPCYPRADTAMSAIPPPPRPRFRSNRAATAAGLPLLALCAGCLSDGPQAPPGWRTGEFQHEPVNERRREYYDAEATRVRREWHALLFSGGTWIRDGREREWYSSGALRTERAFDHGEPSGTWTEWFEGGGKRSECTFTQPPEVREMSWWYENGQLSTRGPALNGVREGLWTSYFEDGSLASRGAYVGGKRDGAWTSWNRDGSVAEEATYRAGVKVRGHAESRGADAGSIPPRIPRN